MIAAMGYYTPIAIIEQINPSRATEIRERDRIKRRRQRSIPDNRNRELAWNRKKYADDPAGYNARKARWCKANPEKRRAIKDKYYFQQRARHMFSSVKTRAKKQGVACDITLDWIEERLRAGVCEMSGLPFDMQIKKGPNLPTIDRRIAGGDYKKENCRMVLWSINRALSAWGDEYWLPVFQAIVSKHGAV